MDTALKQGTDTLNVLQDALKRASMDPDYSLENRYASPMKRLAQVPGTGAKVTTAGTAPSLHIVQNGASNALLVDAA